MFGRAGAVDTLVGKGTICSGNLRVKGGVRVDGTVEGDVEADWVFLGEPGSVRGNITARGVDLGGRVEGNVKAEELVVIRAKGSLHGDLACPRLSIVEGGVFVGRSTMPVAGKGLIAEES